MKPLGVVALAFAAALAVGAPAWAQTKDESAKWYDGTFSVQIENDKISRTDRHYTNGAK